MEFEQMLYRVTEQELIPARYIDFQEFAYNGKLEKTPQGIYFLQPDIAHMNRYYENDKYIHFIFVFFSGKVSPTTFKKS